MSSIIDIAKSIRSAADALEVEVVVADQGSRRHSELKLAWHYLIDAHSLIISGRLTPDDLQWAKDEVERLGLDDEEDGNPAGNTEGGKDEENLRLMRNDLHVRFNTSDGSGPDGLS